MLNDKELDGLLRAADPVAEDTSPDPGIAARARTEAGRRTRRARLRRLVVVPAVAAALAGATAGAYAWVAGDGHATETLGLQCLIGEHTATIVGTDATIDPVGLCREHWRNADGSRPEQELTACVSRDAGVIQVREGGPDVCAANDSDLFAGPTEEQRDLARFREALTEVLPGAGCPEIAEAAETVRDTLAEHGLSGWTVASYTSHADVPGGSGLSRIHSREGCEHEYDVSYDETDRIVRLAQWQGPEHQS